MDSVEEVTLWTVGTDGPCRCYKLSLLERISQQSVGTLAYPECAVVIRSVAPLVVLPYIRDLVGCLAIIDPAAVAPYQGTFCNVHVYEASVRELFGCPIRGDSAQAGSGLSYYLGAQRCQLRECL